MDLSVVPYTTIKSDTDHQDDNNTVDTKPADKNHRFNAESVPEPVVMNPKNTKYNIKYRECMRNHAASIGGHANDGCGEFMPRGKDNTREVLTCAACGCHRNFHRREVPGGEQHHHHHLMHIPTPPPPPPKMLLYNAVQQHHRNGSGGGGGGGVMAVDLHDHHHHDDDDQYDRRSETPERGEVNVGSGTGRAVRSKRQRTKFTQEQKDRMLEFAERIGWRIHRHDDVALNQFCSEIGVKRNVLKVWMHNNKNAYRRKEAAPPQSPPVAAPAAPPPPPPPPQPVGV